MSATSGEPCAWLAKKWMVLLRVHHPVVGDKTVVKRPSAGNTEPLEGLRYARKNISCPQYSKVDRENFCFLDPLPVVLGA